jgi:hypothetical protein
MKNITKYIGNVNTTILTIMSIDSYRRVLESEYTDENINNLVEETVRRSKEIIRKLDDQAIQTNDIENQLGKFKDCLEAVEKNTKNISKIGEVNDNISLNSEDSKDLIVDSSNSLKDYLNKANDIIDKLIEYVNSKSSGNNYNFINIWENVNNFLMSLNSIQLSVISHILVSMCVLLFLWNILLVYYGEKIIIYFNLENNWPRISYFIKLRRKFQDYYIKLNSIMIIFLLLYITYVDIIFLLYNFN